MIFYKLPNITRKLQRLCGKLKTLMKLASFKAGYIIKVLDTEEKIIQLQQAMKKSSEVTKNPCNTNVDKELQKHFKALEPQLIKGLERVEIKVFISEILDDCLSVLTDKGLIQRNHSGWYVEFKNGESAIIKFMDLAIESLLNGEPAIVID